ncbi:MAG: hypothetical protein QOD56_1918, partial [Gammaproteobacteria bacterium]|nr:hypothetical protein [Gammaproteobacteria bacterium]
MERRQLDSRRRWDGTSYALDTATRQAFIPFGNPAPDLNSDVRRGSNLFTNSLVVLDADTGKLKWWYQASPHDARDHDLSSPHVLFTLSNGRAHWILSKPIDNAHS